MDRAVQVNTHWELSPASSPEEKLMKGIFHPDKWNDWDTPLPNAQEIRKLDPEEDKYYREYIIQHAYGSRQKMLMRKLGFSELPERRVNPENPEDDQYEEYYVLREQVAREPDAEILKEAAYEAPTQMARFAFCRLTKHSYPAPWYYSYSYCTYECGWKEGMTTEDVIEFCREMIAVEGPFAEEAKECLADPPRDHNDSDGNRMASHERAVSEPPYVRKQRLAPFRKSEEYDQSRAEVLQLEEQGHEALAAGDKEKAFMLFYEMSYKSERLGKYTQRWEAIDDYARCRIATAEVIDNASEAEKAAVILRKLIRECPGGPEEKVYREHLKKAEEVYRKKVKETAVEFGFEKKERPIVFYHTFDPKDAGVICGLIEERFRAGGRKRKIEFRRQEDTRLEDIELNLILPNGAGDGEIILRSKKSFEDRRPEMGDICCCSLPTMLELYYNTGNIWAVSPFIDTDDVFPEFLNQGTIKGEVCGVPVLVFKGNVGGSAGGSVEGGTAEAAGDPSGWMSDVVLNWAGTPFGREVSALHSWAVLESAGFKTYFTFLNNNNYGLKWLDCLDLQLLMTDSNFINDVCMACKAGGESPHVFPADSTVWKMR